MSLPSPCHSPAALSIGGALGRTPPSSAGLAVNPFKLVDLQHRRVEYLRLSVTDRCNYRCTYCMPAEGAPLVGHSELLSFEEIVRLTKQFVSLGVRKVRLTGGEPLVRRGIVDLVAMLAEIPGILDLSMTTNGHLLAPLAAQLKAAGLTRLNVSLDTLRDQRFAQLTRQGQLRPVLDGIAAAQAAGFAHTKLNTVVLRGLNDDELSDLAVFAAEQQLILRYIEYMPIGVDDFWGPQTFLPVAAVREALGADWLLQPDPSASVPGGGPATRWTAQHRQRPELSARLGFIAAVSEKFCELCNRVRLSSTGTLRECLSTAGVLSLRDLLRQGADDDELRAAISQALSGKVDAHRFDLAQGTPEAMSSIGG